MLASLLAKSGRGLRLPFKIEDYAAAQHNGDAGACCMRAALLPPLVIGVALWRPVAGRTVPTWMSICVTSHYAALLPVAEPVWSPAGIAA
ncbi:hypothetical protein KCP69_20860 [Salmonella enterica subsp. enterica]|nr:hypothetical protein KCP69_20860 [Salmonella enterica subsp. enterica]